jgi:Na+-driven multidrug efflux pump
MQILLYLVGGSVVGSIVLFLIADDVYHIWIDTTVNIPKALSGLMAFYMILFSLMNVFSSFLNGVGKIKMQLIANSVAAIANIPLSYLLAYVFEMGVNGVLVSTIICVSSMNVVFAIQYYKIIHNKAYGVWNE